MRKYLSASLATALLLSGTVFALEDSNSTPKPAAQQAPVKIGIVNFKRIVEESKFGKLEQSNFETLKKQMEAVLEEKEKALNEMSAKFNDPDYIDSLSPEAENELKHKFRMINQELGQIQGQYYQTLNQANMKILQKLNDMVAATAAKIAKETQLDLILNEDGSFYYSAGLDISKSVISALDELYEVEMKKNQNPALQGS